MGTRAPACILLLALAQCGIADRRTLPAKNPTSWTFDASVDAVAKCMDKVLVSPVVTSWGERAKLDTFTTEQMRARAGSEHDLAVDADGWMEGIHSELYFRRDCPLPLYAKWRLHVTAEGPRTKIEVATTAHVHNYDCVYIGHPWGCAIAVPPTTIEEYRLLQAIGACLDQHGMPDLVVASGARPDPAACPK